MAGSVNKVIILGNLGVDPEVRNFPNGGKVCNLRIAEQYLKKGSKVYIEGQLETRKWQDQSGQDRYTTEVVLRPYTSTLTMLDSRGDANSSGGYIASPNDSQDSVSNFGSDTESSSAAQDFDDEIPF